jgi:hypothetical protein
MPGTEGEHRELMAGQLEVWLAQQLDPDDPINVAVHLRFYGDGDTLRQFVAKSDDWPLHIVDVSAAEKRRTAAGAGCGDSVGTCDV